jgi:hypothetical protein
MYVDGFSMATAMVAIVQFLLCNVFTAGVLSGSFQFNIKTSAVNLTTFTCSWSLLLVAHINTLSDNRPDLGLWDLGGGAAVGIGLLICGVVGLTMFVVSSIDFTVRRVLEYSTCERVVIVGFVIMYLAGIFIWWAYQCMFGTVVEIICASLGSVMFAVGMVLVHLTELQLRITVAHRRIKHTCGSYPDSKSQPSVDESEDHVCCELEQVDLSIWEIPGIYTLRPRLVVSTVVMSLGLVVTSIGVFVY